MKFWLSRVCLVSTSSKPHFFTFWVEVREAPRACVAKFGESGEEHY